MLKCFLVVMVCSSFVLCDDYLRNYDDRFESNFHSKLDSTHLSQETESSKANKSYPARSLIRSLVIPGWGQIYNKSPWWKPLLFLGVEVAGIAGWWQWNQKAENIRLKYETFANNNWNIYDWVVNTQPLQDILIDSLSSNGWDPDVHIIGTHSLDIVYKDQIYSSDCLYDVFWADEGTNPDCILPDTPETMNETEYNTIYIPSLIENGDIHVLKDRDYFENIGKYDQFSGGWNGILENYLILYKEVEDTTEIIISSPKKENYLTQRKKSNDYLNLATYSVSAIMFNHVISAFEAVWSSTRKNKKTPIIDSSVSLMYNKYAKYGIGGVTFSFTF